MVEMRLMVKLRIIFSRDLVVDLGRGEGSEW